MPWLSAFRQRLRIAHWRAEAARVADASPAEARRLLTDARDLSRAAASAAAAARQRLIQADPPPKGADRRWRPGPFARRVLDAPLVAIPRKCTLDAEVEIFHDCRVSSLILSQPPATGAPGGATFGLTLESFGFDGSYLSLAVSLPPEAREGLGPRHILTLELDSESEVPQDLWVTLNLEHGPNLDKATERLAASGGQTRGAADFDLSRIGGQGGIEPHRLKAVWFDIFATERAMNRLWIRDLVVTRRRGAAW